MEHISTRPYRMPQSQFVQRLILGKMAVPLLCVAGLLLLAIVVGIIVDLRFLIVGAMIAFIVLPMLMAFVYIIYGMSPRCYPNTTLHTLDFQSDKIVMRWDVVMLNQENEDNPEDLPVREMSMSIPLKDITYRFGLKGVTLYLKGHPFGFIYAPYETFPESTDFKKLVEKLSL